MDAELALYNKIGDLYTKLNKGAEAADMYEKAVKRYIDQGLDNNAIALCNKILRTAPGVPISISTRAAHGAARAAG